MNKTIILSQGRIEGVSLKIIFLIITVQAIKGTASVLSTSPYSQKRNLAHTRITMTAEMAGNNREKLR